MMNQDSTWYLKSDPSELERVPDINKRRVRLERERERERAVVCAYLIMMAYQI